MFINYVTQRGEGGGKFLCYDLIKIVSKVVFLALRSGEGGGVEFGPNLCNVIYEWPLIVPLSIWNDLRLFLLGISSADTGDNALETSA